LKDFDGVFSGIKYFDHSQVRWWVQVLYGDRMAYGKFQAWKVENFRRERENQKHGMWEETVYCHQVK
jgi:hypothetical protein